MEDKSRIHAIDALRGFALVGILITHFTGYFIAGPLLPDLFPNAIASSVDVFIAQSMYWVVMSKFFSIFAFLFGLSFFIQMKSGENREHDFRPLFFWRLVILAGFGLLHIIIFPGDVLFIYAVMGILLISLWHQSNLAIFIIAALLLLGAGRIIPFAISHGAPLLSSTTWTDYLHHVDMAINGGFWDTVKASFGRTADNFNRQININLGRAYITLGFFILGMLVGRMGWLHDIEANKNLIVKVFLISLIASIITVAMHLHFIGGTWAIFGVNTSSWSSLLLFTIFDLQAIAITFFYISGFVLIFTRFQTFPLFRYLSAYGRTALTSYIGQSLIGTFILFNWGLGLISELSISQCLLVALAILAFQILFSSLWLKYFKYGPLEWVWRSLTYMKWIPNK